ncbi:MAG TPA: hypothetical protein ENK11_01115, partial [Phycisphaerales bacterium]|nr:hypothetical protein [Phycisphaerales bacterium]
MSLIPAKNEHKPAAIPRPRVPLRREFTVDAAQQIEQFKALCEQDPSNDMAHFSLGGALTKAGRHTEAAEAYLKCIDVNPSFSKAYQLAGAALIEAGDEARAADVLEKGYTVAAEQGDLMPKKGIAELLEKIGRHAPAEHPPAAAAGGGDGSFICRRTGRPGTKMARPPFRGAVGGWIQENISKETFDEWIALGTKI